MPQLPRKSRENLTLTISEDDYELLCEFCEEFSRCVPYSAEQVLNFAMDALVDLFDARSEA